MGVVINPNIRNENKKFEKIKSVPNTYRKVITMTAVVYSTLPQEYSTLTFRERCCWMVVEWERGAK